MAARPGRDRSDAAAPPPCAGSDDAHEEVSLAAIGRRTFLLGILLILGTLPFGSRPVTIGAVAGTGLALLSWFWLRRFVETMFLARGGRINRAAVLLYVFKYALIGGVIFVLVWYGLANIFALLAGLSTTIIAITLEGVVHEAHRGKETKDAP